MKCENILCVYYKHSMCILDEVSINELGMCDACIHVSFSEKELSKKRNDLLKRFEKQYKEWEQKGKA